MMVSGAPTANAAIAGKSKVVQSPQEQQAAYQAWLDGQLARTSQLQSAQTAYGNEQNLYNELWKAIANASSANPQGVGGAYDQSYISPNVSPDIRQGGINGIPDQLDGKAIDRSALYYGHDLAAQIRQAARDGTTFDPNSIGEGIKDPAVLAAIQKYQQAYAALPQVDQAGAYGANMQPQLSQHTMNWQDYQKLPGMIQDARTLGTQGVNSWNQFIQNTYDNTNANGQGYLDMLGGGYMGGVNPWATNPSWSGTSAPTWQAPSFANGSQMQTEAQQSPWGQAGAPFVQQAWAGGVTGQSPFTPTTSNPFEPVQNWSAQAFKDYQAQQNPPPQQPQSFSGMFNPSSPSPQLATNAPWGGPYQGSTQTNGAAPWFPNPSTNPGNMNKPQQQNPMTFGQNPWGTW